MPQQLPGTILGSIVECHARGLLSNGFEYRTTIKKKMELMQRQVIDLFIFATEEEFRLMKRLIPQRTWNGTASGFLNQILKSPFQKIYVCEWCFERQEYNTDNPQLIIFYKYGEGLRWEYHNLRSTEETEMEI